MKTVRRFLTIFVVTIVMMSVLTLPASAAVGGRWTDTFPAFQKIQRNSTGSFVYALQRYLEGFDSISRSYLGYKNSLGETIYMDGDFGNGTDQAVRYVQGELGLKDDGYVWGDTWHAIEQDLDRYTDNAIILKRDLYNPYYIYKLFTDPNVPNREVLAYFQNSNYGACVAFAWAY